MHTTTQPSSIEEEGFHRVDAGMYIIADLSIREAEDAITLPFEPSLALDVSELNLFEPLMNATVNLDDQFAGMTGEVREVTPNGGLATEIHVKLAQLIPEALLCPCHPALQTSRSRSRRRGLPLMLEHQAFPPCWAT